MSKCEMKVKMSQGKTSHPKEIMMGLVKDVLCKSLFFRFTSFNVKYFKKIIITNFNKPSKQNIYGEFIKVSMIVCCVLGF